MASANGHDAHLATAAAYSQAIHMYPISGLSGFSWGTFPEVKKAGGLFIELLAMVEATMQPASISLRLQRSSDPTQPVRIGPGRSRSLPR
jgi:hypothetical protein